MTESERQRRQLAFSAVGSVLVLLLIVVTCSVYMWRKAATSEGQTPKPDAEDTVDEVTICQLTADPAKYNQKLVKVTGFFSLGFEDSSLYDLQCDSRFSIWYDFGGKNSTGTMYCCGVVPSRTRPEQIIVENIPIPLIVDQNFQTFDQLLRQSGIVRANVSGRFFSGQKSTAPNGREWWGGYGHMGCCSLFMIQQVVSVDGQDRKDLDYGSTVDESDISSRCSSYDILGHFFPQHPSFVEAQKSADSDSQSWMFEDPKRVAIEGISKLTSKDPASIAYLKLKRQTQGRMTFEWKPKNEKATYTIVVSRPYELSFYAKTTRVVWVLREAYRSSCKR